MPPFSFAKMPLCLKIKFSELNMVSVVFWINYFEGQSSVNTKLKGWCTKILKQTQKILPIKCFYLSIIKYLNTFILSINRISINTLGFHREFAQSTIISKPLFSFLLLKPGANSGQFTPIADEISVKNSNNNFFLSKPIKEFLSSS